MKEQLLSKFKERPEEYLSGEMLSTQFSVTRAAVWKGVRQLQELGYQFASKSRLGYRLVSSPDIPYPWEISPLLGTRCVGRKLLYFPEVDSTSNVALTEALGDPVDGMVVVASAQSHGRGRLAGGWRSPKGTGLYFSVALTPGIPMNRMGEVTQLAAQGVCDAVREYGARPEFVMPGDILLDGKKLCGILTEGLGELEKARLVVTGVGVNVNQEEADLEESAVSLAAALGRPVSVCGLFAAILNRIDDLYQNQFGET